MAILPLENRWLWLSEFRIAPLESRNSVSLRGNQVRGQAIDAVLIEVRDTFACRLADNDAEISDAPGSGFAVAQITCGDGGHANASNNRLINLGNTPCLKLTVTAGKFAVLGNTTGAGGIEVNEHPLPDPWDKINITL